MIWFKLGALQVRCKLLRQLVEVSRHMDLARECSKQAIGAGALQAGQASQRLPVLRDHDFFTRSGPLDQLRQAALRFCMFTTVGMIPDQRFRYGAAVTIRDQSRFAIRDVAVLKNRENTQMGNYIVG